MAIRKIIEIDKEKCDACGICIPSCAEHALYIENNELKIREDKLCDGLGACLGNCPKDALKIIEREAEDFDHNAVEEFIAKNVNKNSCASLNPMQASNSSYKWPVKVALVNPEIDFLQSQPLAIIADCAAVACSNIRNDYIKDNVVLLACPKLENKEALVNKFADIFSKAKTKEISIVRMEVPCCMLPELINKAIEKNNVDNPKLDIHIIKRDGSKQEAFLNFM